MTPCLSARHAKQGDTIVFQIEFDMDSSFNIHQTAMKGIWGRDTVGNLISEEGYAMLDDFRALDLFSWEEFRPRKSLRRQKRRFSQKAATELDDMGLKGRWVSLLPAISRKLHTKGRLPGWRTPRGDGDGSALS